MSNQLPSTQVSISEPTRVITIFGAVAAACTALVTVLATIDGVPPVAIAVIGGIGAVATAVVGYLTKQSVTAKVTPWTDVAAKVTPTGRTVAGPAAQQPTGSTVAVVTDTPPSSFQPGTSVYPEGDAEGL